MGHTLKENDNAAEELDGQEAYPLIPHKSKDRNKKGQVRQVDWFNLKSPLFVGRSKIHVSW